MQRAYRPFTRRTYIAGWLLAICSLTGSTYGQVRKPFLGKDLENVRVDSSQQRVYYEQRVFRNPLVGMLEAGQAGIDTAYELVPLYQGVPLAGYRLGRGSVRVRPVTGSERRQLQAVQPVSWRQYKFDFRLQPEFIANFGFKEQPILSKTNLLLQTQLYLYRGLVLHLGVLFPLVNDFDNQPMNIRPAPVYLNQFLALSHQDFVSASAGLFGSQYGLNVQYRRNNLTSPWSFGAEAGLTGFYYFPRQGIYYEKLRHLLLQADVAYRLRTPDVTFKVSGGQYMYDDRGARLDVLRQFSNVEIGIYAMKTKNGSTAGFNIAIPIPPGRIVQSSRVRLRSSEEFRWEYSYNAVGNVGVRYRAGVPLDGLLRQYHQQYLTNQLVRP